MTDLHELTNTEFLYRCAARYGFSPEVTAEWQRRLGDDARAKARIRELEAQVVELWNKQRAAEPVPAVKVYRPHRGNE